MLKSAELQEIIRIIDGSRTRVEALEAGMHNVPEFREFVKLVERTIRAAR